jgi:hypothetical protein
MAAEDRIIRHVFLVVGVTSLLIHSAVCPRSLEMQSAGSGDEQALRFPGLFLQL